ncbi:5451_t:CDS:2 [Acaulospora colombiana]|uniref:5451_t:CDS:1 n=1 Tax=Acaulospora colombiana TaxID=27376 RepID=A0ACA9MA92_9GLOM|nr:5451_t:CDS:2 [Acaulospora colombiana]
MSQLVALATSTAAQIDVSVLDYFLIETIDTLRQSAERAVSRRRELEEEMSKSNILHQIPVRDTQHNTSEEALKCRLENIGVHVGSALVERDRPRFIDTLETIKFLCKDVWTAVWDKQVDNLRTNHRGVYVLQDNAFRPLLRISSGDGVADALANAKIH